LAQTCPGGSTHYWLYGVPETHVHWLCRALAQRNRELERRLDPKRLHADDPRIRARERWKRLCRRLTSQP